MNKGRQFWIKCLIVATAIFLADRGIGSLLQHYYAKIHSGEQGRLTYVIDSVHTPILVLGTSRAAHHYVSDLIADSFHRSCYNAGKDKQGLFYQQAVLATILRRYHPSYILLDLSPIAFAPSEADPDELSVLLPYYTRYPEIRAALRKKSPWEPVKTLSTLYRYNSLCLQVAFDILSRREDTSIHNGYIPNDQSLTPPWSTPYTTDQTTATPDSALVNSFQAIIRLARQQDCRLAVVVSPLFFRPDSSTSSIRLAAEVCRRNNIPFLDYTRQSSFNQHPGLFSDEQHLDHTGALLFSSLLCKDLQKTGFLTKYETPSIRYH